MCSLWKYMLLHEIAREIQFFSYLLCTWKKSQKVRTDEFWQRAFKLFVLCICVTTLHSCYNFAFMLHENALLFSPSEMHHFLLAKKLWYCVGGVCFQRHCDVSSRYSKNTRFYELTWWSKLAPAESFHILIISPSSELRHKYKLNWLFCKFPISNMHLTRHLTQATLLLLLLNMCLLHIHVLCSFDTLGIWPLRLQKTAKNFDDALLLSFVGQSR